MSCGPGRPLAIELNAAQFSCDLVEKACKVENFREAKLHIQRTVNYLVGPEGDHYDSTVGGVEYKLMEGSTDELYKKLGKGVIVDLQTCLRAERIPNVRVALKVAETARDLAVEALAEDLREICQSAKIVRSLLGSALEVVLDAPPR